MTEQEPQAGSSSVLEVTTPPAAPPRQYRSIWLRELPFTIVLILTIAGVAYTTFSKTPIAGYWEILAPIIGLVCVGAGWQEAGDKTGRLRLIVTQALHWGAFLLVMNILCCPAYSSSRGKRRRWRFSPCWRSAPLRPACRCCPGKSVCRA
jgi:hypothetical protein